MLAVSKGTEWGWTSPLTLGLLGGGILVMVAGALVLRPSYLRQTSTTTGKTMGRRLSRS